MRSCIADTCSKIVIAGAGPAGSSLAIRLAESGFCVTLVERERFPRHKLCGEFISPECFEHFGRLGILDEMMGSGGTSISETAFYALGGRSVSVPTKWLGGGDAALGLSRSVMDDVLMRRALSTGADVIEGASLIGIENESGRIAGVRVRTETGTAVLPCDILVDATGRARIVSKLLGNKRRGKRTRPPIIGFKVHLQNAEIEPGRCEIYSFTDGYGGLSRIESGRSNLCVLIKASRAREFASSPERIVAELIFRNLNARRALESAEPAGEWLAVSVTDFGRFEPSPVRDVFAVGDSAAFIDPFTGSGILMALESAETLAECIVEHRHSPAAIAAQYAARHERRFRRRLAICSVLRRAAFSTAIAEVTVATLSFSAHARRSLAHATRYAVGKPETGNKYTQIM
jgi:menaquinone-9 beta-reductase